MPFSYSLLSFPVGISRTPFPASLCTGQEVLFCCLDMGTPKGSRSFYHLFAFIPILHLEKPSSNSKSVLVQPHSKFLQ